MFEKLNNEKLSHNFFFLLSLLILPFLGWALDNYTIVFVGIAISLLSKILLTCDIRLLFLDFMLPFITTRSNLTVETFPILLIPLAVLLLLSAIIIPIKHRIIHGKVEVKGGLMTRSFIIIAVILMLSPIIRHLFYNVPAFPNFAGGYNILFGYLGGLVALLLPLFLLLVSTFKTKDKTPIPNLMYQLAIFLILELAYTIIINKASFDSALYHNGIGWCEKNSYMIVLELTFPFMAYMFSKNWKRFDALLMLICGLIIGLASDSRASQITLIATLPLLVILLVPRVKHFKALLITTFASLGAVLIACLFLIPDLSESIIRLYESLFKDDSFTSIVTGRDIFWKWICEYVFLNPKHLLFGGSFSYCFEMYQAFFEVNDINIWLAHNVFMTFLAVGGLLGLLAIIYHYIDVTINISRNTNIPRFLYILFLLIGFIHGLGDNSILNILFMIPYIFVLQDLDRVKKVK